MFDSINVLGSELDTCCTNPLTGFFRDGCCNTGHSDTGMHTVCVEVTQGFLDFSKSKGNDLSTPRLEYGFKGIAPGDRWCLCAGRWLESYKEGFAPKVHLEACHEETLAVIPLEILKEMAIRE